MPQHYGYSDSVNESINRWTVRGFIALVVAIFFLYVLWSNYQLTQDLGEGRLSVNRQQLKVLEVSNLVFFIINAFVIIVPLILAAEWYQKMKRNPRAPDVLENLLEYLNQFRQRTF